MTGNAKLFLRKGERVGVNTAVHILLDASSSMREVMMNLASQACFAVATALHGLKGISLGVTAFPADQLRKGKQHVSSHTVAPILRHGQKAHTNFGMHSSGGTPMDAALWWVIQQLHPMPEPRKLILIITDGQPDNEDGAIAAINTAQGLGFEVFGIGIVAPSIARLLPDKNSRVDHSPVLGPL
jgi:cobalamin biosynthesis protein CobT